VMPSHRDHAHRPQTIQSGEAADRHESVEVRSHPTDSGSKIVLPQRGRLKARTTVATPANLRVETMPTGSGVRAPPCWYQPLASERPALR
jgi:hypothetical protein